MPLWLSPSFVHHLCIDLGGFDVGMTKQFADGIDVGAACQLQGSERMPEAVEGDVLGNASLFNPPFQWFGNP